MIRILFLTCLLLVGCKEKGDKYFLIQRHYVQEGDVQQGKPQEEKEAQTFVRQKFIQENGKTYLLIYEEDENGTLLRVIRKQKVSKGKLK